MSFGATSKRNHIRDRELEKESDQLGDKEMKPRQFQKQIETCNTGTQQCIALKTIDCFPISLRSL